MLAVLLWLVVALQSAWCGRRDLIQECWTSLLVESLQSVRLAEHLLEFVVVDEERGQTWTLKMSCL